MSNPSITADKTPWYQWDTGLTVTVSGGEMDECHFANRKQGTAYVQAVINGVARVPDELLQVAAPIKAYGYVSDGAGGQTYIEETFDVIARNIPADYTYTKTAQKTIRDAEAARDQAVQAANDAKASELAADDSAVEASNSAQSAGDSASAAATSAINAANSAGDAAKSASDAKAAADTAVEDASELLKTYTDNAKTSADNAATSASNAADAASAASGSASAAEHSATDASNAKAAAQTAKAEAETSASNAATSAGNAAASATAAEKSASDAAASVGAINVIAPKKVEIAAVSSESSFAAGSAAATSSNNSVAIGRRAKTTKNSNNSIAIGQDAVTSADASVCIGINATAKHVNSIAIGANSTTSKTREVSFGKPATDTADEVVREITHVSIPTADTSAATKKYTDDNDAKTLSEAKKYTDANTSNALVGNVSGKLLHVEDAWPGKPLGLTIDGAYKQDGTPSPESPVPIQVVENPVLHVIGRNVLQMLPNLDEKETSGVRFTPTGDGGVHISGTATSVAHYNIDFTDSVVRSIKPFIGFAVFYNERFLNAGFLSDSGSIKRLENGGVVPSDAATWRCYLRCAPSDGAINTTVYPAIYIIAISDYAPYTSATIPITLPSEHPYLAALPDGTHDEIVIDKDGNASLVAKVKATTTDNIDKADNYEEKAGGADFQVRLNGNFKYGIGCAVSNVCIDGNVDQSEPVNGGIIKGEYVRMTKPEKVTDIKSASAYLIELGFMAYAADVTPVTYQLGKLDIPALPETISNAWTDAELTTNMSMTYKRDINIAFDNLVQAVVAAAAGE